MNQIVKDILTDDFWIMPATPEYKDEGIPYITSKNIKNGIIDFSKVNYISQEAYEDISRNRPILVGDILISMIGTLGETAEVKGSYGSFYGQNMFLVRVNESRVNKRYFLNFFKSNCVKRALEGKQNQSTQKYLKANHIEELTIPVLKLDEQELIAKQLDKLSYIIKLRTAELKKIDDLIKARFVELFGDPMTNPKGYPVRVLSEVAEYWNGLTYKPEDVANEGTIVLRSSNIQDATLDFKDTVRVSCEISDKKYVMDNDILMCSRNGSARLVGKVALIRNLDEPMSFGAFMMIIRSAYYSYLMTYFQMPAFRAQITTGATTTINQITGKILDAVKLPVPDLYTINEFSDFVNQVDKSKFVYY